MRVRIELNAAVRREFVLRNESDREDQRITAVFLFCTGNRTQMFVNLGDGDTFEAFTAFDIGDGMT